MNSDRIDVYLQLRRYQALQLGKIDASTRAVIDRRVSQLRTELAELDAHAATRVSANQGILYS